MCHDSPTDRGQGDDSEHEEETLISRGDTSQPFPALVADLLTSLGPDGRYILASSELGEHTQVILERLSKRGRLFGVLPVEAEQGVSQELGPLAQDERFDLSKRHLQDLAAAATSEAFSGVFVDFGQPLERSPADGRLEPLWYSWLLQASEAEIAWVLAAYGPQPADALLAERVAHELLHCISGSLSDFRGAVASLVATVRLDGIGAFDVSAISSAIRAFCNQGAEQFSQALEFAFHQLKPSGRLIVMTHKRWHLQALRRFLSVHAEPGVTIATLLDRVRLAELYPIMRSPNNFCMKRVGAPLWVAARVRDALSKTSGSAIVHVLEKAARNADMIEDIASSAFAAAERSLPRQPPAPEFGAGSEGCGGEATTAEVVENILGEDELCLEDRQRFEEIRRLLADRKAELDKLGISARQQKRDSRVAELARLSQELFRSTARSTQKAQVRCRDRPHIPVLLEEAVAHVTALGRTGVYVDCTFGRGGHTRRLLEGLSTKGRVYAFDVDSTAVEVGRKLEVSDHRFKIFHSPFGDLAVAIKEPVAGILLDLGVSSPQLDDVRRGFSFKHKKDGPLDLRMNPQVGIPASAWLQSVSVEELAWVIATVGYRLDSPMPEVIAEAILQRQQHCGPFRTTRQLASLLEALALDLQDEYPNLPLVQIVFTAIRTFLNHEEDQLRKALEGALERLEMNGRCAVITFNRWEALAVRDFVRDHEEPDPSIAPDATARPGRLAELYPLLGAAGCCRRGYALRRAGPPIRPSQEELARNPRARSATLHVLEKVPLSSQGRQR
eukprot:CAMPEP_0203910870 /NCGR_PEP_ID=MMETSP0359-20131031/52103_1 /ASSEMBLY_ACC=CAM_ASM_000338 /TAXON_ID=268821 /ORGANISM="Scrippsiella Hangoei, Strain SHTV-5" /LENGTH=785 /DNA_ID=CAMNT_0050836445 /DNA_START=44 /DNA_END=2397 /DNA_ORIENTATION=-